MGGDASKIDTSSIPLREIRASSPIEQGSFCPPFRKFKNQVIDIRDHKLTAIVEVEEPTHEQISITEELFQDL